MPRTPVNGSAPGGLDTGGAVTIHVPIAEGNRSSERHDNTPGAAQTATRLPCPEAVPPTGGVRAPGSGHLDRPPGRRGRPLDRRVRPAGMGGSSRPRPGRPASRAMTAPLYVPRGDALRAASLANEAEAYLLAQDPPQESAEALHHALGILTEAARLVCEGYRHSARITLGDPDLAMAAAEAFPLSSPESEALGVLVAAVQGLAAGRGQP